MNEVTNYDKYYVDMEKCVDDIIARVGRNIVLALPLALGKPCQLVNAIYRRAKNDSQITLKILTALSLEKPVTESELEGRLLRPIVERIWDGVHDFEYVKDLRNDVVPENITICEFYTKAGMYLNSEHIQQNFISSNFTHIVRDAEQNGMNVLVTAIAKKKIDGQTLYSLSSNSDTAIEVFRRNKTCADDKRVLTVGQVNTLLPFMYGDAVVSPDVYDIVIDAPEYDFQLFSTPKTELRLVDHMIGLEVSSLIKDGGTLQLGIGALNDAIGNALIVRQRRNDFYRKIIKGTGLYALNKPLIDTYGGLDTFSRGIYGATEMFGDVFLELYKHNILKRKVFDHIGLQQIIDAAEGNDTVDGNMLDALLEKGIISYKLSASDVDFLCRYGIFKANVRYENDMLNSDTHSFSTDLSDTANKRGIIEHYLGSRLKNGCVCHGTFFIGPSQFYENLRNFSEDERRLFAMTTVENINQLYGNEMLKRHQRRDARFVNIGMKVDILGGVISDGLENGKVVSGVGGQYNSVAMAHALENGRVIIIIKSTRRKGNQVSSNIVFNYGHCTIPRHLRDIIVTEYGIADVRGKTDKEVICALLNITDSRFQYYLLHRAKRAKKIPSDYRIPLQFRNNYPKRIETTLAPYFNREVFPSFPFGMEFKSEEIVLANALREVKNKAVTSKISTYWGVLRHILAATPAHKELYVKRMGLEAPVTFKEKLMRAVVLYALKEEK